MADILDGIEDLNEFFGEGEIEIGEIVEDSNINYAGDLDAIIEKSEEMNEEQAREITEAIRSAVTATYILLAQAHKNKAYKALGYDTWADYISAEFDFSTQRSYQLLNLNKVIESIEAAAPEGTKVKLTEAQARDLKRELPKITEQIREETVDLEPEEAEDVIDSIINDAREQQKADQKVVDAKEKQLEEAEMDGYHRGLEAAADSLLEADMPTNMSSSADDELIEVEVEGEGTISPSDSMSLYQFVNSLTGIGSLPEPDEFIDIIPDSRFDDLYDQVKESSTWLNRLSTLMEFKHDS